MVFVVTTPSPSTAFGVLATDQVPCLDYLGKTGQFFSRYIYEADAEPEGLFSSDSEVIDGYRRKDNISDETLMRYQKSFGGDISKDDIFSSIYALLHSEYYLSLYSADVKRQLPRIPLPVSKEDFFAFADAGRALLSLHIDYEAVEPYKLAEQHTNGDESDPSYYRLEKLRWGGTTRKPDKTRIIYNDNLTLIGIPDEAHEYMVGARSALEWLIDRYKTITHKTSGIFNDPNEWACEQDNPRYIVDLIKRIVTVSVETRRIVRDLPELAEV